MTSRADEPEKARAEQLYHAARCLEEADRRTFLATVCGRDATLRDAVDALLSGDAPAAPSLLDGIAARLGCRPDIRLSDEPVTGGEPLGKYVLGGLLGSGGIGRVVRGRDRDLNREVAIKLLHEAHLDRPEIVRRFVEEAQIGGQLQHPGIVPVYDLGMAADAPFFAMKLVKGATLSELLAARESPADDRQRFLQIFLQICQTVAFAHARGVIHRDLKPQNVMVGRYGEVQVVDWGMGKVLGRDAAPPAGDRTAEPAVSVIDTLRSDTPESESLPGSILGTPSYMSPEQATGDIDRIGTAADVFGLGAVLCEVLTGQPPYVTDEADAAKRQRTLLSMAMRARLDDAWSRLDRCGADPIVVALCRECLDGDEDRRPADAEAVATRIGSHLAQVEARAQGARLEAAVATQRQRWLTVIVAVVVAALAATGWLWRSADEARAAAERAREEALAQQAIASARADEIARQSQVIAEQKARAETESRLIGHRIRLDEVVDAVERAFPAWPENAGWLAEATESCRTLVAAFDEIVAARDALRARAAPPTPADESAVQAYLDREVAPLRRQVEALRLAAAVRSGAPLAEPELDAATAARSITELDDLAWARVAWNGERTVFGEEPFALAVARHAFARARATGLTGDRLANAADTLAWACFACGLDEEAKQHSDAAAALASAAERDRFEGYRKELQLRLDAVADDAGSRAIARLEAQIARHEDLAPDARDWQFGEHSERFLHRILQGLVRDLWPFRDPSRHGDLDRLEHRLAWAERVTELTVERHRRRWDEAIRAIRAADGVTASTLYAASPPLELTPQTGLVPIGMNPVTKLWEFYHLRSAWDAGAGGDPADTPIPVHGANGDIAAEGETGIVFVLLPGGRFTMGGQNTDPAAPNHDPFVQSFEPLRDVTVAPFFIARHELTQGQWARLASGDSSPSWYRPGMSYSGIPMLVGLSHPVENVDWDACTRIAFEHGLGLPAEDAWEYACRAGTTTPWATGATADTLAGHGNVLDLTATALYPQWGREEGGFEDGFAGPAPVGTFRPNGWGLYDMHGNVLEWTATEHRLSYRVCRGGSFGRAARDCRSACRIFYVPAVRRNALGVRLVRAVRP